MATAAMLLAVALVPAACASAPPPRKPVQMRLLQFLGSSDPTGHAERSAGRTWLAYLSQLKLAPAVAPAPAPAAKPKKSAGTTAPDHKAGG